MSVTVSLDLKKLGLTHARGQSDRCEGQHEAKVEYEDVGDIPISGAALDALQRLHTAAHPHDSVWIGNCAEITCRDVLEMLGEAPGDHP